MRNPMSSSPFIYIRKEVSKIKVFIKDNIILSDEFDNDMIITYLGLRQVLKNNINNYFISIGLLSYHLTGKQIASKLVTKSILSGLSKMIEKKIITTNETDKDRRVNDWVLNLGKLQIDKIKDKETKEFYSSIESDNISKILNSDMKDKIAILRFYCYLITTLTKTGDKQGAGFTSYIDMATYTGITRQTISSYMDKLENSKYIYIYRSNDAIVLEPNIMREIPNVYGDIKDKDKIINIGKTYEENYGNNAKKIKSTKTSKTRSASAKYNILMKDLESTGEIRYKPKVMKEIYESLLEFNRKYSDYEKDPKDLSIFSNYDFYKGEI